MRSAELYKSNISLRGFENKLYIDPQYGLDHHSAVTNYAVFSNEWDIEDVSEDHILKIIHRTSGDTISLSFNSLKDKINFIKNIYAAKPIKQVGKGMELESLANGHLKPSERKSLYSILNKIVPLF
jgi:hypothetical protein